MVVKSTGILGGQGTVMLFKNNIHSADILRRSWNSYLCYCLSILTGKMPTVVSPELYRSRFCEAMDKYFLMVPDHWTGLGLNCWWARECYSWKGICCCLMYFAVIQWKNEPSIFCSVWSWARLNLSFYALYNLTKTDMPRQLKWHNLITHVVVFVYNILIWTVDYVKVYKCTEMYN